MSDRDGDRERQRRLGAFVLDEAPEEHETPPDSEDAEPPTIKKKGRVLLPDSHRTVGWWGLCPERGTRAFVSVRSEQHRLKARDAYAISDSVLDILDNNDVGVILIVESDTNDVYEFTTSDFRARGGSVPVSWLSDPTDTQTFRQRIGGTLWENHRGTVYRPRDEDVQTDDITPTTGQ